MKKLLLLILSWTLPLLAQTSSANFEGFYIGINGGVDSYTWGGNELDPFFNSDEHASYKSNRINWEGGAQLGYNWICCNKLFGLVADWNWTDASPHLEQNIPGLLPTHILIHRQARWLSTIRARGGLLWSDLLLYITAGAALIDHKTTIAFTGLLNSFPFFINERHAVDEHRWGWSAGLGTEYALGCGWTLAAEILYSHFDSKRFTFQSPTFNELINFDFYDEIWVGRIALNYHFSLCSLW